MSVATLRKCYKRLREQLNNNEISNEEAQERAIKLLAEALDLQRTVTADTFEADQVNNIVNWLDEIANTETVSL